MLTIDEAEEKGYTIDRCTYPYLGYKGPRFAPTEHCEIMTERECEMATRIEQMEECLKKCSDFVHDKLGFEIDNLINSQNP